MILDPVKLTVKIHHPSKAGIWETSEAGLKRKCRLLPVGRKPVGAERAWPVPTGGVVSLQARVPQTRSTRFEVPNSSLRANQPHPVPKGSAFSENV